MVGYWITLILLVRLEISMEIKFMVCVYTVCQNMLEIVHVVHNG
jgi:hypothetical protein